MGDADVHHCYLMMAMTCWALAINSPSAVQSWSSSVAYPWVIAVVCTVNAQYSSGRALATFANAIWIETVAIGRNPRERLAGHQLSMRVEAITSSKTGDGALSLTHPPDFIGPLENRDSPARSKLNVLCIWQFPPFLQRRKPLIQAA